METDSRQITIILLLAEADTALYCGICFFCNKRKYFCQFGAGIVYGILITNL